EIDAVFARRGMNRRFIAEQGDPRDTLARTLRGGHDRTRIVTLGKNDVLWSGTGALSNSFENVHMVMLLHVCGSRKTPFLSALRSWETHVKENQKNLFSIDLAQAG